MVCNLRFFKELAFDQNIIHPCNVWVWWKHKVTNFWKIIFFIKKIQISTVILSDEKRWNIFWCQKINFNFNIIELFSMKRLCLLVRMSQKLGQYLSYWLNYINLSECVSDIFHKMCAHLGYFLTFYQTGGQGAFLLQITYDRSKTRIWKVFWRRTNAWAHIFEFWFSNGHKIQIQKSQRSKIWISTVMS